MSTFELIQYQPVTSTTSSVTLGSIPQTFDDLVVIAVGRSSISSVATDLLMGINGFTTGFTTRFIYSSSAGIASSSQAQRYVGTLAGSTTAGNQMASNEIHIRNYTGSTYKTIKGWGAGENYSQTALTALQAYIVDFTTLWSNTAAITSLEFASNSGNIVSGSSFSLYGISHS